MSNCRHGMEPGTCALCNAPHRMTKHRKIVDAPEATIRARFDSECDRCEGDIIEGTELGLHQGSWIHLHHFEEGIE